MTPGITCLMPTCGRTLCIGESIYSFINQTYSRKKLIILDTHPQDIKFDIDLPDSISYIKMESSKFNNLGDKYRELMGMVDTELFCIWEDDDLWLSSHLERLASSYTLEMAQSSKRHKIGNRKHFFICGGVDKPISKLMITSNVCWCRYAFENKELSTLQFQEPCDVSILKSFEPTWQPDGPTYIYRWANGQEHMSGFYGRMSYNDLFRFFEDKLCKVDISEICVNVSWRHDYETLCERIE